MYISKKLIVTLIFPILFSSLKAQVPAIDTLLKYRNDLIQKYDLARLGTGDSGLYDANRIVRAAQEVINYDNKFINSYIPGIKNKTDSIQNYLSFKEIDYQKQQSTIKNLNNDLVLSLGVSILLFFLMLICLFRSLRWGRKLKSKSGIIAENERLIAEYRKRVNELQNDLENNRTQTKTLASDNSRLSKEISQLETDLQKARDAGWIAEKGSPSFQEKIKELETRLAEEETRKKIMEQELVELLRKIRGDE
ncbi:MAG: hypothetical protein NTU44_01550 [Bacteroidetes bacterium]|nr:hypothetical protein [Bacteroidota bacterium]